MRTLSAASRCALAGLLLLAIQPTATTAQQTGPKPAVSFKQQVVPILQQRCVACHNEQRREGDLSLATAESITKGGSSGPVIRPGDSQGAC